MACVASPSTATAKGSTRQKEPAATVKVGSDPVAVAFMPNSKTAYVVNSNSGTVTPINTVLGKAARCGRRWFRP